MGSKKALIIGVIVAAVGIITLIFFISPAGNPPLSGTSDVLDIPIGALQLLVHPIYLN